MMLSFKFGLATKDLGDQTKVDDIVHALKETPSIMRAQQYHGALHRDCYVGSDANVLQDVSAVLINSNRYRLAQSDITTHVLCAMQGVMLSRTTLASWFMSTNYILPENPCSIAVQISLLADSNILHDEQLLRDVETIMQTRKVSDHLKKQRSRMDGSSVLRMGSGVHSQCFGSWNSGNAEKVSPQGDVDSFFWS